ncbi:MAG: glycoside hydrolase family 43 protein [Chloroflexi bacterium]|nr:glycoside hydrolase family 43 protein [Chloroflexota bacterium]
MSDQPYVTSGQPLISHLFTADPSAHVFNGRIYLYPSHDRDTAIPANDNGDQYDMADYHVFSMESLEGPVTDHGVALALEDIPWASRQLWAPDAAMKNGTFYLYFPARDKNGIFRVGVAVSSVPHGPFRPDPEPIAGSYSIDPCSFVDDDGAAYLYFGGLWGGQLQCWDSNQFDPGGKEPSGTAAALQPRVARLAEDMRSFAGDPMPLSIVDAEGQPLRADDHERRFFEAAWLHGRNGVYYFSYSTGDTHFLVYATADNPLGPFTYRGRILEPVIGWTTHHSIVEFEGRWYLFYHDASLSGGVSHLRCVKVAELFYDQDGAILPVTAPLQPE